VYPGTVPATHPTYLPLPLTTPLTAADLACYVALPTAPAPLSNPYLTAAMRPAPSWPTQSGISVVPAAMLAADVLPEYYYGLHHDGTGYSHSAYHFSAPVVQPHQPHHQPHHHHHHHQQQQSSVTVPQPHLLAAGDVSHVSSCLYLMHFSHIVIIFTITELYLDFVLEIHFTMCILYFISDTYCRSILQQNDILQNNNL